MTTARKLSLIICKVCGQQDFRGRSDAEYCTKHILGKRDFKRLTECKYCGTDISQRNPQATTCLKCSTKRISHFMRVHKNDNETARKITKYAVKLGFLLHPTNFICMDCKKRQAECYDHRDYNDPLKVEAVCLPCNASRGRGIPFDKPPPKSEAA